MPLIRVVVSIASTGSGVGAGPLAEVTARGSVGWRSTGPSAYPAQETKARVHQTMAHIRMGCHLAKRANASTIAVVAYFVVRRMPVRPQSEMALGLVRYRGAYCTWRGLADRKRVL